MLYIKTELLIVITFFVASFFEASMFAAFGYGLVVGLPYFLYKGMKNDYYKEVKQ
ncbi:hypothetical protein [Macrococcoides goetzii]|uniref:hypothetical protein n=1 Tax=Macrococcoides goetzii TaxID=1891097 RepID=UPI001314DE25|nr:hypothetical protein [Macrococcus goetzii]